MMKTDLFEKYKKDRKRLERLLSCLDPLAPVLPSAHAFLKSFLGDGDYAMRYRHEHCVRAAHWGKRIAEKENWNPEPLTLASLLHDAGYPFCKTMEEWPCHAALSARVAGMFLAKMGYDAALSASICRAIEIHDRWEDVPLNATAFELSVRDADDLDRFDVLRLTLSARADIGEQNAAALAAVCEKRLAQLTEWEMRPCGTEAARQMWLETLAIRRDYYTRLHRQMQATLEMAGQLSQEQDAP